MIAEIIWSAVGISTTLGVAYFLDKKITRPMCKDRFKKISLSYLVDKHILKKENDT